MRGSLVCQLCVRRNRDQKKQSIQQIKKLTLDDEFNTAMLLLFCAAGLLP